MGTPIEKIFRVVKSVEPTFSALRQSPEAIEDYSVKKVVASRMIQTDDHNASGSRPEVVNVIYGTGAPPAANTTPIGTIYVQYT